MFKEKESHENNDNEEVERYRDSKGLPFPDKKRTLDSLQLLSSQKRKKKNFCIYI